MFSIQNSCLFDMLDGRDGSEDDDEQGEEETKGEEEDVVAEI